MVTQDLEYDPEKLLIGNTFQKGDFAAYFKDLSIVNVTIASALKNPLLVIDFDTFAYTAYSSK